jgi:hypothetical protein
MDREVSGSRPLNVVRYSDEKGDPLTPISSTPPTPASELAHESDGSGAWRDASFPYQEEKTLQHVSDHTIAYEIRISVEFKRASDNTVGLD